MLAQDFSPAEMRRDYGITAEQVQLALRFAADYLKAEGGHAASVELPSR